MRRFWAVFGFVGCLLPSTHISAMESSRLVVETSPDAALIGNLSVRSEVMTQKHWYLAMQIEHDQFRSEKSMTSGNIDSVDGGINFYPDIAELHGPFMGVGLGLAYGQFDHQRNRPSRTYFQPTSQDEQDEWSTTTMSVYIAQTLGYRINFAGFMTASAGVQLAEILHSQSSIREKDLMPGAEVSEVGIRPVSSEFFLNLGIYFQ